MVEVRHRQMTGTNLLQTTKTGERFSIDNLTCIVRDYTEGSLVVLGSKAIVLTRHRHENSETINNEATAPIVDHGESLIDLKSRCCG
ncbi:hypothetical protein TNCV_208821 [Trichonephila clavipes]|uniref:Uncharacterized protein n=1 Tax=Trichonephila clavipes TaxID=2585209 RepID=A0A8X6SZH9_TRICX|nr:hypothetical protein TNCV_208821 [Trichonephila clavipes]